MCSYDIVTNRAKYISQKMLWTGGDNHNCGMGRINQRVYRRDRDRSEILQEHVGMGLIINSHFHSSTNSLY